MDASHILPHRAALIGAAVALVVGMTGGVALRVGAQDAPAGAMAFADEIAEPQAQPISWPNGKVPDYLVGTDFLRAQQPDQPMVVASYEVPEYVPATWPTTGDEATSRPEAQPQPVNLAWSSERAWPSTGGDILDTRLPEDAPSPPEPPEPTLAMDAPDAPPAPAPLTMAAAN